MIHQARPYQKQALDQIRDHFKNGTKKVLLWLPTGGGKTFVFSQILKGAAEKGTHCIMVVRGRSLVEQAHERLVREGVHHGVLMNSHWNFRPTEKIQICSIDTLRSRAMKPEAKIVVIDEAHMATSPSYLEFLGQYPDAYFLPVTATPYTEKSMRHMADVIVHPASMTELANLGYLVLPRYFAPSTPDLRGVKVSSSTHDYVQDQLEQVMMGSKITGDVVSHWLKFGENRPTVCFAVSIAHSLSIMDAFNAAGVTAEHCEAGTPQHERKAMIKRLESGQTKIISNVGILCTGVDIPPLSCLIMARPTKSYNLFIQQAGRGTRPFPGKDDFLLLDHAGNVTQHGFITEEPPPCLDGTKQVRNQSPRTCDECFGVYYGTECPYCGKINVTATKEREIEHIEGELVELTEDSPIMFLNKLKRIQKEKGYKRGWIYHKLVDRYGEEIAQKLFPKRNVPDWVKSSYGAGQ